MKVCYLPSCLFLSLRKELSNNVHMRKGTSGFDHCGSGINTSYSVKDCRTASSRLSVSEVISYLSFIIH